MFLRHRNVIMKGQSKLNDNFKYIQPQSYGNIMLVELLK